MHLSLSLTLLVLLSFIVIAVLMISAGQVRSTLPTSGAISGQRCGRRLRRRHRTLGPPQTFNEMQQAVRWFHTSSPGAHNDPRHTNCSL